MAESVVSGLVSRLGNLLLQEANFLFDVSDQVEELQTELRLMQSFLKDADARQEESETVKQCVADIREVAYDADDIIGTYELEVASRRGGGIQKILKRCTCILYEVIMTHIAGSRITKISKKIYNLRTSLQSYGISASIIQGGDPGAANERQREQRQTYSHLRHDVVGFEDDLNKLVAFLLKEEEGDRAKIASICGMGGLGKTTLAKMVYNHHEVKQHFDCRAWVFISQQCQRRNVWEGILFSLLSLPGIRQLRDEEIVDQLLQVLKEKKCLLILDDIWNIADWEILCEAFSVKDTGSKILLTTRYKGVALRADPNGFHHELQFLNDEKSWELLEKIAISRRSEDPIIKTNMKSLGNEMLKYCGGLPLAIAVLGGLLATKHTQEEWEEVHRHVKPYLNVQEGLQFNKLKVLDLSYNELPCHLKPCFLYLGHFPEDFEIPAKELVRMWMAEGFIQKFQHQRGREDTMEDIGERYLRELVQRCMVLVGKINSLGRIKTCRIHDLMRDFCVSKAQAENFLITNVRSMEESEAHIGKIRRLAINVELDDDYLKVKGIKFNKHPYLKSLLYFGWFDLSFKESRFKNLRLLRVLNLKNLKNYHMKLPEDIGCLIHLRFLSLKGSNVNNVPSSMGNLRCLQTLDLRYSSDYVRVPNVFKKMEQLRHLYLPTLYKVYEKLEVGNLCYLQTLVNVWPRKIRLPTSFTFNRLRVLKVVDRREDIIEIPNARSYFEGSPDIIQIVSSWPHIYNLCLEGRSDINDKMKKLPEVHPFSSNLAKLTLLCTFLEEDPMATLEKFPNLKILYLLGGSFVGKKMVCSERGFPRLQSLLLYHLRNLEEWRVEKGAMSSLCRLEIEICRNLTTIPDGLRFVTTLQELKFKSMPKTFKDRVDKGGEDFCKVQHVPSLVFQHCDRD